MPEMADQVGDGGQVGLVGEVGQVGQVDKAGGEAPRPSRFQLADLRQIAGLTAALAVPLIVAAVALSRRHWSPVLDLAMTELRVRDVGSADTPLIGLPGRIGNFPDQGSHPGPLSFYLLAPVYRIFGSNAWSLELGSALIHIAAITAGLTLAWRRGGARTCLTCAAIFAVILRGYGVTVLTQPWNPYLPVIAWMVVLLAVWSVLEGDAPALVVLVAAGSLCAQTHVPYLALVGGLGVGLVGWLLLRARIGVIIESRRRPHPLFGPVAMPGARRWSIIALIVGLVLWSPPVADQLRRKPGNLSMLGDYFRSPPEEGIGWTAGLGHLLRHLDLAQLAGHAFTESSYFTTTSFDLTGSVLPGALLVVAWLATAVVAWRMRHRALIHLHVVVGAGYILAFVAMARIFGKLWYYLTLWAWGLLTLCLYTMVWTVVAELGRRRPELRPAARRVVVACCAAVIGLSTISLTWSAAGADPPERHLSDTLTEVVGPTADAIRSGAGDADGPGGSYIVTWSDAAYFGSQGYGLVNELERRGFEVGVPYTWRVPVTLQRVIEAGDATAEIHLATGVYIEQWRSMPGAVEVAYTDPRNPTELALYEMLREQLSQHLTDLGLAELIELIDTNLFGVQLDARVPAADQAIVDRMLVLGQPTAVFIVPAGTSE